MFSNIRKGKIFLNISQNPGTIKEKTVKLDYIKIKNFYLADTVTKDKRQMTVHMEWGLVERTRTPIIEN